MSDSFVEIGETLPATNFTFKRRIYLIGLALLLLTLGCFVTAAAIYVAHSSTDTLSNNPVASEDTDIADYGPIKAQPSLDASITSSMTPSEMPQATPETTPSPTLVATPVPSTLVPTTPVPTNASTPLPTEASTNGTTPSPVPTNAPTPDAFTAPPVQASWRQRFFGQH